MIREMTPDAARSKFKIAVSNGPVAIQEVVMLVDDSDLSRIAVVAKESIDKTHFFVIMEKGGNEGAPSDVYACVDVGLGDDQSLNDVIRLAKVRLALAEKHNKPQKDPK